MKKEVTLYNVLFPLWMLLLFPVTWFVVIPVNFLVDSLVLLLGMHLVKIEDRKSFYKNKIWKVFGFGFLSDGIGAGFLFVTMFFLDLGKRGDDLYLTIPALLISAICIFLFNFYATFRTCEKKDRVKLSLLFAIVTAPYTFLVPLNWLY